MARELKLTDAHRLAFLAGVTLQDAEQALAVAGRLRAEAPRTSVGSPPTVLTRFVEGGRLKAFVKPNPNGVTQKQVEQLPGVSASRAERVMQGGPYFTLNEYAAVTGVSKGVLAELVQVPRYERLDKMRGKRVVFEPEPNVYVSELPAGFEAAASGLDDTGYVIQRSLATAAGRLAVIGPAEFQAASGGADRLKRAVAGRIIPAVRDPEGMLRLFVPRRVDIWFAEGTPATTVNGRITELGLALRPEASPKLSAVGFYPCEMRNWPEGDPFAAMFDVIARAQAFQEVRFAEPDEVGIGDFPPDASSPPPAGSDFEATGRFWNHDLCGLPAAHAMTRGSGEVTIITIDSGIATGHPDLAGALQEGWQALDLAFATGEPDAVTSPESAVAHGTKVGSIAVGSGRNPDAVLGIAPGCRLLPIRITGDATTAGYGMRAAAIIHALKLIGPARRAVMNLSWGMAGDHTGVRTAIEATAAANVVVTMSAGNYLPGEAQTANQLHYPSSYCRDFLNVLSVAAINDRKRKASYSYFGSDTVSLCAPGGEAGGLGVSLYSARPPNGHDYTFGTSFSVVHACGAAALMLSANPTLTANKVAAIMKASGQQLEPSDALARHLGPLLDVAAALAVAKADPGTGPTPAVPTAPKPSGGPPTFPVSINVGTEAHLVGVPSMSPDRAKAIIADRGRNGVYSSLWDLRRTGVMTTFIIGYWEQGGWLTI